MSGTEAAEKFPRQQARTRRFSLGNPRNVRVSPDGRRVLFLRARAGDDPSTALWLWTPERGEHQLAYVDDASLEAATTPEERARRERMREQAAGIVAFATDDALQRACFTVGGQLWVADLDAGEVRRMGVNETVVDPRLSPDGTRIAYVSGGSVAVLEVDAVQSTHLTHQDSGPDITWGLAEFVAGEEMGRTRGFWWSPDSTSIAAARVDTSPVQEWFLPDPVDPSRPPASMRYPSAGTANAEVTLHLLPLDGREPTVVDWNRDTFPYLAEVVWSGDGPLTLEVQSRDQRHLRVLTVGADGATEVVAEEHARYWTELVEGVPRWTPDGRLLTVAERDGVWALLVDGAPLSPPGLQIRAVAGVTSDAVVVTASGEDPTSVEVWTIALTDGDAHLKSWRPGVASASVGGDTVVLAQRTLDTAGVHTTAVHGAHRHELRSVAEEPVLRPRVQLLELGERRLRAALVLPHGWEPADGALPVLLDPYGGPHAQRVLAARAAYLTSQWFAEAGFAVLVIDGRGTPGRGPEWEQAIADDLSTTVLTDQLEGLQAAADTVDGLDLSRVAIRGWSFGGYLAALAVLRRPDLVHAAVAGAPVTDWALYDTHYTERYLGTDTADDAYARVSLLNEAAGLERPLLLIHGLNDDNVVFAHTLELSRALVEAGRPHQVLPLSGVTHMTPQEVVAENLLRLELAFLRDALGHSPRPSDRAETS